jgi:hypothetical protein
MTERAGPGRSLLLVLATGLLSACAPDAAPPAGTAVPASPARPGLPAPACEILGLFRAARAAAAEDLAAIALALPPGARDAEAAWVLARAPPAQARPLIEALEAAEVPRLERALRLRGGASDPAERDPALLALARAGILDAQPLVARALRTEGSERSLAALAEAAALFGPAAPVEALKTALARARTPDALLALTASFGPAIDADAVRVLASRGSGGKAALEEALRVLRGGRCRPPRGETGPGPRPDPGPAAVSLLRARARQIVDEDAAREAAATAELGARLGGGGGAAAEAADALREVGTRAAALRLAAALPGADRGLAARISAGLAAILQIAPERRPEDVDALTRAWFPILATLLPDEDEPPRIDLNPQ